MSITSIYMITVSRVLFSIIAGLFLLVYPSYMSFAVPNSWTIDVELYIVETLFLSAGTPNEKEPASNPEIGSTSLEDRKRKRVAAEEDEETVSLQTQLIDVLERNGQMLTTQLEAHNENFQLDREQRKDDVNSLIGVLNKLSDALARIADKL